MNRPKEDRSTPEEVSAVYQKHAGNISAVSRELGVSRQTVRRLCAPGLMKKPLAGGSIEGTKCVKRPLPKKGQIARYILTSAQNNTYLHTSAWANLLALAKHYRAEIIVGTYTYNQNNYGKLSVKKGTDKLPEKQLWYAEELLPLIKDTRIELAKGLVWCGEYNALPTNVNPLAGLESYTGRKSAIFPHAKLAVRSIPGMQGEGVKLNYTTGTVTQCNYIQKREGVIAEFHHIYGGLLVEVNSDGNWWVRQLNEDENGVIQDLDVVSDNGLISTDNKIEAITHGDLHGVYADPEVVDTMMDLIDELQPRYQFLHDIMEGAAVNPHERKYKANHERFRTWLRGYHRLENELEDTAKILQRYERPFSQTVIVDSNHDDIWLKRWLREHEHRVDPPNAEIYLDLQAFMYSSIRNDVPKHGRGGTPKMVRDINVLEYAMKKYGHYTADAIWLSADESFKTCDDKIENGMHGHLGPNGRFGTPENLSKMPRKCNTAHTHSTGIWNGLYVAGTSALLRWDYAKGPNSQTHSHVLTYPNGKRTLVTFYNGKWRA